MAEQPQDRSPAELLDDYLSHVSSRHELRNEMADIRFRIRTLHRRLRVGYLRRTNQQIDIREDQLQPQPIQPPQPPALTH